MDTNHSREERFLWLEAKDVRHNIARRYTIALSGDLFGALIVTFAWGRIGTRGQSRTVSFAVTDEADRFVRKLLQRRASARRRIGAAYREVCSAEAASHPSNH